MKKDLSTVDLLQPLRLSHHTEQITYTSSLLTYEELELLERMLQRNIDIFALTRSSMSGIHVYHAIDLMFHRPRGLSGKRSSISIRKNRKSSKKKLTNYWQSDLSKMSSIQTG